MHEEGACLFRDSPGIEGDKPVSGTEEHKPPAARQRRGEVEHIHGQTAFYREPVQYPVAGIIGEQSKVGAYPQAPHVVLYDAANRAF